MNDTENPYYPKIMMDTFHGYPVMRDTGNPELVVIKVPESWLEKLDINIIKKLQHENHLLKFALERIGGIEIMKEVNQAMKKWIEENK